MIKIKYIGIIRLEVNIGDIVKSSFVFVIGLVGSDTATVV